MSDKSENFEINNKKEFLITYPHDYFGALEEWMIWELWVYSSDWEWVISKETGHEEGDKHDHFHVYLRYIGKNKKGFCCRGKNASRIWDIKLNKEKAVLPVDMEWPKDSKGNPMEYAHPNIKFKGDKTDPNCKNTYKMIDYVTKQRKEKEEKEWKIWSCFDWQIELKKLEKKKSGNSKRNEKDQLEFDFCDWLRSLIKDNPEITKNEVIKEILNNSDWSYLYMSKFINYNSLINAVFKEKPNTKPIPFFGKYWVPVELKEYLDYLNNWFEMWYKGTQPIGTRPKALYLSGCGNCGKSSLIAALGTFSYWCNIWNMNNWESKASFNFYDDFDISEDFKGNPIQSNWTIMKPWIGGQPTVTISGKYKQPLTVRNDKPCIFVSNQRFEDRWNEEARKYWHDCNATIVDLGNYKLYNTPEKNGISRKTIGGFTGWVEYDTTQTWYFKMCICGKTEEQLGFPVKVSKEWLDTLGISKIDELNDNYEASEERMPLNDITNEILNDENKENEPPASPILNCDIVNNPILIESDNESDDDIPRANAYATLGRLLQCENIDRSRRKRKYSVASTSETSKKTRYDTDENLQ